jgi:hypothetical protein
MQINMNPSTQCIKAVLFCIDYMFHYMFRSDIYRPYSGGIHTEMSTLNSMLFMLRTEHISRNIFIYVYYPQTIQTASESAN